MIAWLTSLLMEWGYVGLFIATFLSGTALPFSSELILFGLIKLGLALSVLLQAIRLVA